MATGRYADYFNDKDTADVKMIIQLAQSGVKVDIDVVHSGVKVVIKLAESTESHARRQLQLRSVSQIPSTGDLCAHSIILKANSPVWKAQLERWQGIGNSKTVTITVEEGEQGAAYSLLQCLYTDCLADIETELDLCENLRLLRLADQYQVEAALSMCTQKLEELEDLETISWELADWVMQLPAGYLEKPGLSCLLVKIQEKILQHIAAKASLPLVGLDLEVVMRNSTLEESLMALPLRTCANLLSDDRCRVASENTVAAAVLRRLDRCAGDEGRVELADLRAHIMAGVIRVPHLSPLFAAAMPKIASPLTPAVRPETYALGRELQRLPPDHREEFTEGGDGPCFPRCWLSGRRPLSTVTALEFDWEASIAELADKFDSGTDILASSPTHFFAGMDWAVKLYWETVPGADDGGCTLGLYICGDYPGDIRGPYYEATMSIDILAPDKKSSLLHKEFRRCSIRAGSGWGWEDFFDILPMQKWDQSRVQKWTSPSGFLTIRVKISDVM